MTCKIWTASRKLRISCMLYLHKQAPITWFLTSCCISLNSAAYFSGRAILMLQENILSGKTWNAVLSSQNSCMKQTFLKGFLLAGLQQGNILNSGFGGKGFYTFKKRCGHLIRNVHTFQRPYLEHTVFFSPKRIPSFLILEVKCRIELSVEIKSFSAWIKWRMH